MPLSADVASHPLEDRTALITGASRGIGRATATRLAAAGCHLALLARTAGPLEEVARELGGTAVVADVSREDEVRAAAGRIRGSLGGAPDIIVNAAGSFALAAVKETSAAEFDRQLASNLRGPFLIIRAFLSEMIARGSGHVVIVGSIAGRHAFPHNAAYAASKFGVRGLHDVLATEVRGTGVRTSLIEPAATDTDLWQEIDLRRHPGLPDRNGMLSADAVAAAILFVLTQPPTVAIRNIILERA